MTKTIYIKWCAGRGLDPTVAHLPGLQALIGDCYASFSHSFRMPQFCPLCAGPSAHPSSQSLVSQKPLQALPASFPPSTWPCPLAPPNAEPFVLHAVPSGDQDQVSSTPSPPEPRILLSLQEEEPEDRCQHDIWEKGRRGQAGLRCPTPEAQPCTPQAESSRVSRHQLCHPGQALNHQL